MQLADGLAPPRCQKSLIESHAMSAAAPVAAHPHEAPLEQRLALMTSLARDLHEAGTTAPRLEAALSGVATKLSLTAQVFSAPTVIMLSLRDVDAPAGSPAHSELLRVEPNDVNLGRLRAVDDIAERLVRGEMAPLAAHAALAA